LSPTAAATAAAAADDDDYDDDDNNNNNNVNQAIWAYCWPMFTFNQFSCPRKLYSLEYSPMNLPDIRVHYTLQDFYSAQNCRNDIWHVAFKTLNIIYI